MNGVEKQGNIVIHNASENNLKNITVSFPLNKFTCITGPSGCGKSSLVYDTLFAESQRNFLESMAGSLYGHRLLDKPHVEAIENLRPALDVSQKCYNVNPRSTVGTATDISYYLRTLFAFIYNQANQTVVDMNYFSPNTPVSCCDKCKGTGEEYIISMDALMPDPEKTLASGGITYYKGTKMSMEYKLLAAICERHSIDIQKKLNNLSREEIFELLYRDNVEEYTLSFKSPAGKYRRRSIQRKGAVVEISEKLKDIDTPSTFASISRFLEKQKCSLCNGLKYNSHILEFKVSGANIAEVENLPISEMILWVERVRENYKTFEYSSSVIHLLDELNNRLQKLIELDLGYISVSRSVPSLSGGELQRVRLANQLGCSLSGLIYILDEPCRGLHYNNIVSIVNATKNLIKKGNTVLAIEHNRQYVATAQKVVELGPVGGPMGGYLIGTESGEHALEYKLEFKSVRNSDRRISLIGVNYHNLRGIDVQVPIGCVTAITGVSGSGKSSLADVVEDICSKGYSKYCQLKTMGEIPHKVLRVDQKPIGKTPRSTVVSYLGIYDEIRTIYAEIALDQKLKLKASDFSMNVPGGRCECCQGTGRKKIELSYLPEQYICCPECKGKRFNSEVLSVKYKGKNIDDILNLSINELLPLFINHPRVYSILESVYKIGLGYLSLGQMSMNLSGGEAQRIKLAKCLGTQVKGGAIYILDEPTAGLNDQDITFFVKMIQKMEERNETVILIDHNPEFIAEVSDYMVDLGNMAGKLGGTTIISGEPEQVMRNRSSSWYMFISQNLKPSTNNILRG